MRLGKRGSDWCNLLQQRRTAQHSAAPYPVIQYSGCRKTGNFPVSVLTACKLRSADMSAASHWPAWRLIRKAGAILCPRSLLLSFAGDTSTDRLNLGAGAPGGHRDRRGHTTERRWGTHVAGASQGQTTGNSSLLTVGTQHTGSRWGSRWGHSTRAYYPVPTSPGTHQHSPH